MRWLWLVLLAVLVLLVLLALMAWALLRGRARSGPSAVRELSYDELTDGEKHVLELVGEVHGEAVIGEKLVGQPGDVRLQLELDPDKSELTSLDIGLSSLARKQKQEGLTDAALKVSLTF